LASALAALNMLKEQVGEFIPEKIISLTNEEMKACYCSRQKASYIKHLAETLLSGQLNLSELEQLPDNEVRDKLIALKGIGNWTADIYLIFVLHHPDIFPVGDLAVVNALRRLKNLPVTAGKDELIKIADGWKPYRTIAAMLLWHYYLSAPKQKAYLNKTSLRTG